MIRTLRMYLTRELAKATALATIAFTLVMTIFAILEPLRTRGLSGEQALSLFGYSMPVMVSLTLPIAALFAATIVYGRFSQDNELMACRASGISTLALLRPALWLAIVVSALTLSLSLYAAPKLLEISQRAVRANLRQIVFHQLATQQYVRWPGRIVHTDRVDPESGWMAGVVVLDYTNSRDVKCLVAASAKLELPEREGRTFAIFSPTRPAVFRRGGGTVAMEEEQQMRVGELPTQFQDEPKLYDWGRLCRTWSDPQHNTRVEAELVKIKHELAGQAFYADMARVLRTEGKYDKLHEYAPPDTQAGRHWVSLSVREVHETGGEVQLGLPSGAHGAARAPEGPPRPKTVSVRDFTGERMTREFQAATVRVRAAWERSVGATLITLNLLDVDFRYAGEPTDAMQHRGDYTMGPYAAPPEVVAVAETVRTEELYSSPGKFEAYPEIVRMLNDVKRDLVRGLQAKVQAEMHQRLAYGLSCLLMVLLGAALGLLLRGGQMLAAFAISAIPASLVIILLIMGRQLLGNPTIPAGYGIAVIWTGVAILAGAAAYLYAVHMRQ